MLPVLALTMSGCATTGSHVAQVHEPTPGYVCHVRLDDRKTSETWLRADGSVFSSQWEWAWRSDFETGLSLWVTYRSGPDVNPDAFPVAVITSKPFVAGRKRPVRTMIGLTNRPGTDWLSFHYAIAKGELRRGDDEPWLWIAWSDLVAYVEGSPALYLLTQERRGKQNVTSRPIPRSLILNAHTDITAMAQQMAAKVADYAAQCEAVDDIDPLPEILV